jgi:hypothetical protein
MSRANLAVFRSKALALANSLHLSAGDVVDLTLRLAVEHAAKAGIDRKGLHSLIDDNAAKAAIEGASPARQLGGTDWEAHHD